MANKVKITPPDYLKENYLVTFTPHNQLTPEQIFWSQDLIKMKAEALKKHTTASRPIKALTVYLPNTPATLVPKALIKEMKEMKDGFEELEAEVGQNVVDMKHDEIERKNLLITHDNLIADCLSKEVFYVATNFELNVSTFTKMHDAHTIVEARCLELEDELSNLCEKIQNDNHNELVKWFSKLEVNHLNLQLKYQNLKASFGNNPTTPARDTPDFDSAFVIGKMKASRQGKDNTKMKSVTKDHVKPIVLAPSKHAIDVEPIPPRNRNNKEVHLDYLRHLKESVETLYEIVEEAKVERPLDRSIVFACRYNKHSQELLEYAIGQLNTQQTIVHVPPSIGVNYFTNASGSQPRRNTKKHKISPAKGVNKKKVKEHPRTNKSNLRTTNYVDSSSSSKRNVINSNSDSVCQTCRTDQPLVFGLTAQEFHEKVLIGTVRFGNDHFGAIMGYGDYVIGNSVISK
ncbi:hypothetical protein Tco_1148316, partial [Tanacetum coccineum]